MMLKRLLRSLPGGGLSLKARLMIGLSGLLVTVIIFSGMLLFEQYRVAVTGTRIALRTHAQSTETRVVRDALESLERKIAAGRPNTRKEMENVRSAIVDLHANAKGPEALQLMSSLRDSFEHHVEAVERLGPGSVEASRHLEDTTARLNAYMEFGRSATYQMVDALIEKQGRTVKLALIFLIGFICIVVLAGYRMIVVITDPLSRLAAFVDSVNFDDELPARVPSFHMPELNFVANSFDRLMNRLRGYRAVNVRRLLAEKRRADVIAASLSDGICLLKGDEIVYTNPVAERILAIGPLPLFSGISGGRLSLSVLLEQSRLSGQDEDEAGKAKNVTNRGAAAILEAVSRTMPVEYTLETENGRHHYLIQAHSISCELIEQIQNSEAGPRGLQVLDNFQENTIVIAQDVTLVREGHEAKGHFLATLSHEIKTPVTSLTMAIRLLAKNAEVFPASQRMLVRTCAEDVERLRKLLDDLLTVSNFNSLTQRLQCVEFIRLFRHTVQTFQALASERGVALNAKVVGDARVSVSVDPSRVTWAFSNLLTNAIRHTPRGGSVEATVETFEDRVGVRVRDSGPGIDRKRQARIFDKFSSFYDIRVARSGGSGTGLAIAREIVVAHGGRIWVNSEPGAGAEFCFMIPRRSIQAGTEPDASVAASSEPVSDSMAMKEAAIGATARS